MRGPTNKKGNHKVVQYVIAKRRGITALGKEYKKGTPIVHFSSTRSTGEGFVALPSELSKVIGKKPATEWKSAHPWRPRAKKVMVKKTYPNCHVCFNECVGHMVEERVYPTVKQIVAK